MKIVSLNSAASTSECVARTSPSMLMRTIELFPRFNTYISEPPPSVVLLAKLPDETAVVVAGIGGMRLITLNAKKK